MSEFMDILFEAEKLVHDLEGYDNLPKVDRSVRQVLEASNELYARIAQSGAQDIQANLLLGSKGIDLPQISQKLENLSTRKTFEPLEPVNDTDVHTYLKHETEACVMSVIDEINDRTTSHVTDLQWDYIDKEWEQEKQKLISAMVGPSESFIKLEKGLHLTSLPDTPTPSALTNEEALFAKQVSIYNKYVIENNKHESLIDVFTNTAKKLHDPKVDEMWTIIKRMTSIPPLPKSNDPIINRSTPPGCKYLIKTAKTYLEERYKTFMNSVITENLESALRGGVPGVYPLVRSFVGLRFHGEYLGLQDGLIDERPLWPMIYYCVRCGDYAAALQCVRQANITCEGLMPILEELVNNQDSSKIANLEAVLKFQYKRSIRNSTDPYKRAVYCVLSCCDVVDEHSEVAKTADDYLWLKLSLIRDNSNDENLSYSDLQTMIIDEYGEAHYQAYTQPHLYFQVLALTGQFEAAIEFLSRIDRYRTHAVHMAIALNEMYLLGLPRDVHSPLIIIDPEDVKPTRRLNVVRLIMLYVHRFELTNPAEAVQYYFMLRNIVDSSDRNLFAVCITDLALECRNYDLIFGKIEVNGIRSPGLLDQFNIMNMETEVFAGMVAVELSAKGQFEEAIKLYDLANKHEEVLKLMSMMLSQVVQKSPTEGSTRQRLQVMAEDFARRYASDSMNCSRSLVTTFYILKDLLRFFDMYHNEEYVEALELLQTLQLVPFSTDEVEEKLKNFKNASKEMCAVFPDVLLATMNILYYRYRQLQDSELTIGRSNSVNKTSQVQFIRDQAKAITNFAGTIPYRLPGDINGRLVQMEILMH